MVFTVVVIDIHKTKVPLSRIDKVRLSQVLDDVQLVTALTVCFLQLPSVSRRTGSVFSDVQKRVERRAKIWKFFRNRVISFSEGWYLGAIWIEILLGKIVD